MLKLLVFVQNFLAEPVRRDDRGATAVEYGLIVTLIAVAIIAVVTTLGTNIRNEFQAVVNAL
ncbi:MAG TPA: Flp family type IVb pilin [Streptosporangiaceae bacterium]|jgi:pilus assembly protein Flp/PilA